MLQSLTVKNYALIESLQVDFTTGLSTITGETGAGKSILLGALGLVLGKRADLTSLKNKDQKCIIEVNFAIQNYPLKKFFTNNDLDYETNTIIRREILPSGKSRAFLNDTPVTLNILQELSEKLIDIHSQHQTLHLANTGFQFQLIDALAKNDKYLASYKRGLILYKKAQKELQEIQIQLEKEKQQYDYNLHLFEELEKANFKLNEQESLEQELEKLNHSEEIKLQLNTILANLTNEEQGVLNGINSITNSINSIANYSKNYDNLSNRLQSVKIELEDLAQEIENENEQVVYNPLAIEKANDRLQLLYDLHKKHKVETIAELLVIKDDLDKKVLQVDQADEILIKKQKEVTAIENELDKLASTIHKNRTTKVPFLIKSLTKILGHLEMPYVTFKIELNPQDSYFTNGKDEINFLISVNKGTDFIPIKKGPSGGEMSRIMLAIKTVLSNHTKLPTIIFDEIDTGVSGEVATKIANVMQEMSKNMQIITITHLPQIAAKGETHYKVFKQETKQNIETNIKQLIPLERVNEIAEMLGGKTLTDSAVNHAKQLLEV